MYSIEVATPCDAPGIAAVHAAVWREVYTYLPSDLVAARSEEYRRSQWGDVLHTADPSTLTIVMRDNSGIVGFAHMKPSNDPDIPVAKSELHACYLLSQYRGTPAGPMMMATLITGVLVRRLDPFCIWAWRRNPIRRTYASLGLRRACERERTILGHTAPEVGYVSADIEDTMLKLLKMTSLTAKRVGASGNQQHSPDRLRPTALRIDTDRG